MEKLLPSSDKSIVHIFDANSDDRRNVYGTDLRAALKKLGENLSALQINEEIIMQQSSSGDAGIDLIGYINISDNAYGSYYITGQVGAQETGWPKKTLEASPTKLRSFMTLSYEAPTMMFTPVCYRESTGKWVNSHHASGICLLDRVRMLALCEDDETVQKIISDPKVLEFDREFQTVRYEY